MKRIPDACNCAGIFYALGTEWEYNPYMEAQQVVPFYRWAAIVDRVIAIWIVAAAVWCCSMVVKCSNTNAALDCSQIQPDRPPLKQKPTTR
jgi:hypothetical protein